MTTFTESTVEEAALEWLSDLGYQILPGPEIAPDTPTAERSSFADVVLEGRLREALARINSDIPPASLDEALRRVLRTETPSLAENNRQFHKLLTEGVPVEYQKDGRNVYDRVRLIDFINPDNNDWLAVNQFSIKETKTTRRPDIIIFVNGLPLAVIELKNAAATQATVQKAFNQLQTYKADLPGLMTYNMALVISDGLHSRVGTLTADWDRFMPWRTVDGETIASRTTPGLDVLLKGIFEKSRFLDMIDHFIVHEVDGDKITKKMAGYHQFHAVNKAVQRTFEAVSPDGDRKAGVIWHTQGSGKSLTMTFFAGKIIRHPQLQNPTLVVLTDRNDLDDQLFGTFSLCRDLLRQNPQQAENRNQLKELLQVVSGGVIFTTLQKFAPDPGQTYPALTDRRNIIVMADEAHRSQYGHNAKVDEKGQFTYGFSKHLRDALPNASFLGFTGTPVALGDKNTQAVFGDYIDVYDISRAVEDGATVKILYEARLAKLQLKESERPHIDEELDELTENEELATREKWKSKWAAVESLVGSESRIEQVAKDLVQHWDQRLASMDGKAMIVCMSRRICVELYKALVKLRPEWHSDETNEGVLKIVMTGSAGDPKEYQPHIHSKGTREDLAKRFKKPADPLKLVIVRDMWLTGFDAPCLHTLYVDKPMSGHNLMQAIARVNRVFKDKPGGLVVDYLGIATELKRALSEYTRTDQQETAQPIEDLLFQFQEKLEIARGILHGYDYSNFFTGKPSERLNIIPAAMEHILQQEDGKPRFNKAVAELSQVYALISTHDKALPLREEIAFFQCLKVQFSKLESNGTTSTGKPDYEAAVRQIISKSVASDGVLNVFQMAGIDRPDISILSDEFLEEVKGLPHKNVALEVLRKLLNDEIKVKSRTMLVQARNFSDMLDASIKKYLNRSIDVAQVISELIEIAKKMREAEKRGEELGLTSDERAFYEALEVNDSAVKVLGDSTLKQIAQDLVDSVRRNVTIDWTHKDSVRAKLRILVKKILKKYGYPPDKQAAATETVLAQAELLCDEWT